MKWIVLLPLLLALTFAEEAEDNELKIAEECDREACKLPECRCSSSDIPGGLKPRNTPQFVTVTFDDAVNVLNIETYRAILYNRRNSNGCNAGATFYVNHEYTNYQLVNELYNRGYEIALHSITHRTPNSFWATATYEDLVKEFVDQRRQMSHFANIPMNAIQGIRKPFLQLSGNTSFLMMANHGLKYDCSWPSNVHTDHALWPYTLDHASTQDCPIGPCPTASIPGPWVMPMISWRDLNNFPCSMVDTCVFFPDREDEDEWFKFIMSNFERHYFGNRAPFGFFVHEWYIREYSGVRKAFIRFMDVINNIPDVFMVNSNEVIEWVKNPIPVNEYREKRCPSHTPSVCRHASCGPLRGEHNNLDYWMQICTSCPR
ncbi:hypothetical protein O3G_MSEX009615, partial [Manduca sexta]